MQDASSQATVAIPRFIEQDWAAYTVEQHTVWALLYARRMAALRSTGRESRLGSRSTAAA